MDMHEDLDALMRKYSAGKSERDQIEYYAELYACLKTLEKLERAYSRGIFSSATAKQEYETECKSLISQCRSNHECIRLVFPDIARFADTYKISCPRALIRCERGLPATLEHGDGGAGLGDRLALKHVNEATEALISLLDVLRMELRGVEELNDPVQHTVSALRTADYLVPRFAGRDTLVRWSIKLGGMRAVESLEKEDVRQLLLDTESAYREFKEKVGTQ